MIVEDVNLEWFEALDKHFGLDPQFILAYASSHGKHNLRLAKQPLSMVGKWYTADLALLNGDGEWTLTKSPQCNAASGSQPKSASSHSHLGKATLKEKDTSHHKPWWQEGIRQPKDHGRFGVVLSRMACYGLAEYLRELCPHLALTENLRP